MGNLRLGWFLTLTLAGLCTGFVLLSVLAPGFMGRPVAQGHVLSLGVVMALVVTGIAIGAGLYFEHRLNAAARASRGGTG